MSAFIEWIFCPSGIVRVGVQARRYGDPFEHAVAVKIPWRSVFLWLLGWRPVPVVIKALVAEEDRPLKQVEARLIIAALRRRGFRATWERHKKPSDKGPETASSRTDLAPRLH